MSKEAEIKKLQGRAKYWRELFEKRTTDRNNLSSSQMDEIASFWDGWQDLISVDSIFHSYYLEKLERFDVRFMPTDLYYCFIDPYYNNWETGPVIDNKCTYARLFPSLKQPETLFCRANNMWIDSDMKLAAETEVLRRLGDYDEVVIKKAKASEGGKGIYFISHEGGTFEDDFEKACHDIKTDIVVQSVIRQHEAISRVSPTSVNTIRIMTLLRNNGVKLCSAIIRMGINGSRVDNVSKGGIACGIEPDGRLKDVAYNYRGTAYHEHPTTGVKFDTVVIPNFDKACELVKEASPYVPDFRLVSWDLSIDETGEPLLVEANLWYGALNTHQLANGPIFGDDTLEVLKEVFAREWKDL